MFKINSNKKVIAYNKESIYPQVGGDIRLTSISLTEAEKEKLNRLRAKYKLTRSAIVRILLNAVEE